ncbi:phage tail assembly protein [Sphingomonas sp. PL-96]|uniref:phage tail assembly protein n=1 Tax=Sphingomonas sp. PL-96 TaxID=2887201 RepID=UPI001E6186EF|nr:phage tail assembly protein [Sphingomonas sp. PL-96]MCC2976234.1 phage tail assembly protein [Sphingomonas sp. PL-96]
MTNARKMTCTVELEGSLKRGDAELTSLTFRRPETPALIDLSLVQLGQMNVDELRKLLPRISADGLIAEEVDKLGADDMLLIAREISTFMDKGETVERDDDADADAPRKMNTTAMLSVPIAREGSTALDKLELRRPDAGALRNLSLSDVGQLQVRALLTLLPRICTEKLTRKDLLKIDFADWMEIAGEVGDFLLPRRLRTA